MTHAFSKRIRGSIASQWNCETSRQAHYPDILQRVFEDVNSPKSLALSLAMSSPDSLLEVANVDPNNYSDHRSYTLDNLSCTLVKKYSKWDTSINTKQEAMKTFISCEIECSRTNNRIVSNRKIYSNGAVRQVLNLARGKIEKILGSCPSIQSLPFVFGPGATFLVKGRTTVLDKLDGALDVTPEAENSAILLLQSSPGWLSLHGIAPSDYSRIRDCLTVVDGDRLSFVPKTAKTDRPIAIGPGLNVLLQKGYGSFIRNRLKLNGLNLNRCPSRHKELARKASIRNDLATVDLSSASDTISDECVYELLPHSWYKALDAVRSHRYTIEDKWYEYHKFSAMGNGFTFELESLIFYALSLSVLESKRKPSSSDVVSVFGDDIILPADCFELLTEVLGFLGFSVNKEKTFVNSYFRESCGGDFFKGSECRGFYIKDSLRLFDIVRFRNYLYRTGYRFWLPKTWRYLREILKPFESYLAGPDDGTDDHIVFDDYSHLKAFNFVSITTKPRKLPRRFELVRVFYLYSIQDSRPFNVSLRYDEQAKVRYIPSGISEPTQLSSKRYIVTVSSRYIRKYQDTGNFPWEEPR